MPREVFKQLNANNIDEKNINFNRGTKFCNNLDKENVENSVGVSKGTNPKAKIIRRPTFLPTQTNRLRIASTDSYHSSKFTIFQGIGENENAKIKKNERVAIKRALPSSTVIYDSDEHGNPKLSRTKSFSEARRFFVEMEQAAMKQQEEKQCIDTKKIFRRSMSMDALKKKFESIEEESEVRATIDNMVAKGRVELARKAPKIPHRRIAQLKGENNIVDVERCTPFDLECHVPPVQAAIKYVHKHCDISHIGRGDRPITFRESLELAYTDDIMEYYLEIEKNRRTWSPIIRSSNINLNQRKILIAQIINICKDCNYPSMVGYQAVRILDDVLGLLKIPLEELQLMELASLWIALKRDAIAYRIPKAEKMISFSEGAYTTVQMCKAETQILQALNFTVTYADVLSALSYNIINQKDINLITEENGSKIYYCGSYMIDASLFDQDLMMFSPILISAIAAQLALIFIMEPEEQLKETTIFSRWLSNFAIKHFPTEERHNVRQHLIQCIVKTMSKEHYSIVLKKYQRSRFGKVSQIIIKKISMLI